MSDLSAFVTLHNATLTTDSKRVASHFGKRHDNVLRAFDNLDCSPAFRRLNFEVTMAEVLGPKGATRLERVVHMTKDGFIFLVMGFTGKEAARIKEAYIAAFNAMGNQLQAISMNGYHRLWDRRLNLEKRDQVSFMWASFGARKMNDRKREKPSIDDERRRLDAEMQPNLPGVATVGSQRNRRVAANASKFKRKA